MRMDFQIHNTIPHSMSDLGLILFWVIWITLFIAAIIILLYYFKVVEMQENLDTDLDTTKQMKKSKEEKVEEPIELKDNTEKTLEEEKKNL
jgi:predicted Holliday junction resolvase-like endonuclease